MVPAEFMKRYYRNQYSGAVMKQVSPAVWTLAAIVTFPMFRNRGYCSQVMRQLCADADRERVTILAMPEPISGDGLTKQQIIDFNIRHGFEHVSPKYMKRVPNKLRARATAQNLGRSSAAKGMLLATGNRQPAIAKCDFYPLTPQYKGFPSWPGLTSRMDQS